MSDRPTITIVLEPLPDTVAWPIRVRALLKTALRRLRLKCLRVTEQPASEEPHDRS
jgi:hypothetical protein